MTSDIKALVEQKSRPDPDPAVVEGAIPLTKPADAMHVAYATV